MTWTWKRAVHALRKRINAGDFAVGEDIIDFWVASSEFDPTWHEAMKPLAQQALAEKTVPLQLIQETGHYTQAGFAQARLGDNLRSWALPMNIVWNLPKTAVDVHGEVETVQGSFVAQAQWAVQACTSIRRYAALAIDTQLLRVFGWRQLLHPREDGYQLRGRVSLGGEQLPASTGSMWFMGGATGFAKVSALIVSFGDWPTGGYDRPSALHPLPKLA